MQSRHQSGGFVLLPDDYDFHQGRAHAVDLPLKYPIRPQVMFLASAAAVVCAYTLHFHGNKLKSEPTTVSDAQISPLTTFSYSDVCIFSIHHRAESVLLLR